MDFELTEIHYTFVISILAQLIYKEAWRDRLCETLAT